jgi:DNA-binding MarR family transcriptional regulator
MITDRIGYHLKHMHQAYCASVDATLRELGLTTAQYAALGVLETAPGISNAALARACFVTPQTMNEIVQSLQAGGLVQRTAHPIHGRILQLDLTPLGQTHLGQAHQLIETVEERMVAGLGQEEQQQFVRWLQRCSAALEGELQN